MGVSLDVYRVRIGTYNGHARSPSLSATSISQGKVTILFTHLPLALVCIMLFMSGIELNPGPMHECKYCHKQFATSTRFCEHSVIHQSTKNFSITCGFPDCRVKLSNVASYKTHVSRVHQVKEKSDPKPQSSQQKGLCCPVESCTQRIDSKEFYNRHMVKEHLCKGDSFVCIYEACKVQISYIPQFRTHLSRYHKDLEVEANNSEPDNIQLNEDEACDDTGDTFEIEDEYDASNVDKPCEGPGPDLFPDSIIKEELAKFYLKLESVFVLPTSTVQAVAEEIKLMTELSHYRLKRALRNELQNLKLDEDSISSVVRKTFKQDTVFNVHHKHEDVEQMVTNHLRMQYWKKYFPFVEPVQHYLGTDMNGKKRYAHYVPMRETLGVLLQDPVVKDSVLQSFHCDADSEVLSDFTDGTAFNKHRQSHDGPCLQILLFQDGFDFNPLGASSGIYKPNGFYYMLGNLPPKYRSKVDLIQLVYMILEKDLKPSQEEELQDKDKLKKALKPLLDEIEDLYVNGILIDGVKVRVCLLFCVGDSLGQHIIGGFVKNFSSTEFSCRFCPMSKTDFRNTPYETRPLRLPEDYNKSVKIAKETWFQVRKKGLEAMKKAKKQAAERAKKVAARCSAPSKRKPLKGPISKINYLKLCAVNFQGVKYRASPLISEETGFHVISAQPPCLAHDLFEGIVKDVVPQILKNFIEDRKWFDLPTLNYRIKGFKCKGADARDAPTPLKSLDKLSGNACENWNLLRLLPFIIGDLVEDKEDGMWKILLELKEICEYVCAPKITVNQVGYLQALIRSYLSNIKEYLPSCLTPKHHFLCHYPDLILIFGPLIRLFTLRFESKHMFFKQVVRACKSYINITFTMAKKYMCRFAFDHISSILPLDLMYNPSFATGLNVESMPLQLQNVFPEDFNFEDAEELRDVTLNGIQYLSGLYFVLKSDQASTLHVGCIEKIILQRRSNKIFFIIEEKIANNSFDGYFTIPKESLCFVLKTLEDLPDYFALPSYKFDGKECLSLKHTVITMH